MDDLNQKTVKSVMWSAVERFGSQGIQFVMSIIIARLLLPEEYGLIAMLAFFMAIAQTFVDSGFGSALIQKNDRNEIDYSTAFYFNFVVAVLVYLMLFLAAPFIADFYKEEKLIDITRVVGISVILNSFGLVQRAKLSIALDFKKLALASTLAVFISGLLGIWMAYTGYGVWALVAQTVLNNLICNILLWTLSRWSPLWVFSKESFIALFSFGSKLLLSSLLHTVYTNLYTLVIGKFYSKQSLGSYYQASNLATFTSNNISAVIVRAIYPIQCSMQDDDEKLKYYFSKYLKLSCYVIFPISVGLCALAEPLVKVVLNVQWIPAIPYIQILCIAYMWNPVMMMNSSILNVKGRSDYFLRAEVIKKIMAIIILVTTIPFGIKIMCWGLLLYSFTDMIIITIYTKKLMGLRLLNQFKDILPIILLTATMGLLAYGSTFLFINQVLKLLIGTFVGLVYFLTVSKIAKFEEFTFLLNLVKKQLKR
ncbi:MAG TPA: lipopolysaccharide biosynthesis protein [Bacteroidales bacterium]